MKVFIKYWYWVVIIALVAFIGIKSYFFGKTDTNLNKNNAKLKELKDEVFPHVNGDKWSEYVKSAERLSMYLGTAYPVWHYRHYYEEDEKVFHELKAITTEDYDVIEYIYANVYSRLGNGLTADLLGLLDSEYYKQLQKIGVL